MLVRLPPTPGDNGFVGFMGWSEVTATNCRGLVSLCLFFFFQAEDGIRDRDLTGVQTCALPICSLKGSNLFGSSMPGNFFRDVKILSSMAGTPSRLSRAESMIEPAYCSIQPICNTSTLWPVDRKSVV